MFKFYETYLHTHDFMNIRLLAIFKL